MNEEQIQELRNLVDKLQKQGLSTEEIQSQVDLKKQEFQKPDFQTPTAPGAVVEETAAPDMESNSESTSSELPKIPNQIGSELDGVSLKEIKENTKKEKPKYKELKKPSYYQEFKNTFSRIAKNFTVDSQARKGAEEASFANAQLEMISNSDSDSFLVGGRYSQKEGYTIGAIRMNKNQLLIITLNKKPSRKKDLLRMLLNLMFGKKI